MDAIERETVVGESLLRLVDEFADFGPLYLKWVRSRLQDGGMTYARMRLLGALHCKGPQIMSSISDELGVTRRNVTALVDALEEEGLLRRKPHPTDRRATVLALTASGRTLVAEVDAARRADAHTYFARLSERDREALRRILTTLDASD